jgi:hypothetical protein
VGLNAIPNSIQRLDLQAVESVSKIISSESLSALSKFIFLVSPYSAAAISGTNGGGLPKAHNKRPVELQKGVTETRLFAYDHHNSYSFKENDHSSEIR